MNLGNQPLPMACHWYRLFLRGNFQFLGSPNISPYLSSSSKVFYPSPSFLLFIQKFIGIIKGFSKKSNILKRISEKIHPSQLHQKFKTTLRCPELPTTINEERWVCKVNMICTIKNSSLKYWKLLFQKMWFFPQEFFPSQKTNPQTIHSKEHTIQSKK